MPILRRFLRGLRDLWRTPLRQAVHETRCRLAEAVRRGDRRAVVACVAEIRAHADRADAEAADAGFVTHASALLRDLADETEAMLGRTD